MIPWVPITTYSMGASKPQKVPVRTFGIPLFEIWFLKEPFGGDVPGGSLPFRI